MPALLGTVARPGRAPLPQGSTSAPRPAVSHHMLELERAGRLGTDLDLQGDVPDPMTTPQLVGDAHQGSVARMAAGITTACSLLNRFRERAFCSS